MKTYYIRHHFELKAVLLSVVILNGVLCSIILLRVAPLCIVVLSVIL